MKKIITLFILILMMNDVSGQSNIINRVEPLNWWVGMPDSDLQLLVYGKAIQGYQVAVTYPGVTIKQVETVTNPNYLFIDIQISDEAKAGTLNLVFTQNGKKSFTRPYVLKDRSSQDNRNLGVTDNDLIYLIMPDRFSNGDPSIDKFSNLREQTINRDSMYSRHGGDIQGVINHLDYIRDCGFTTIWMTPEIENDMAHASYHGYAATDLYKIDPRYGTNELYLKYVETAHSKGLKVIKDVVPNHVGTEHWFVKDMPFKDWVHQWPEYTNSNYRDQPVYDPHASDIDRKKMLDGWFVPSMPDLNESNPMVAKYLTQNYLWWLEYAGIDGFRIDTYPYNDPQFMSDWVQAVRKAFPNVSIFGETLVNSVPAQAFFTEGNTVNRGFDTHLPGVTDAQIKDAIFEAINGKSGWVDGVNRLYAVVAQDFLYKDPTRNVIFLDNHDMSRAYSILGEDIAKYKAAIALLLTMRGIPQVYYGTEILMKNFSDPDGKVREDFKGGWSSDKVNKFTKEGRTALENETFNYFTSLANYRKASSALQTGRLMQYVVENDVYVYFRYDAGHTVMVVYNASDKEASVNTQRFEERTHAFTKAKNIILNTEPVALDKLNIPAKTVYVYELQP